MGRLSDARRDARLFLAMRRWVRGHPHDPTPEEGAAQIRADLATREKRFLEMMDRCIWRHASSPYLPLLKAAGCEAGDVRTLLERDGLEAALLRLREEGVYVTFEEFKGRRPIERRGIAFAPSAADFDNPQADRRVTSVTGGSTGAATRVWINLQDNRRWLGSQVFARAANGNHGIEFASWIPPNPTSLIRQMTRKDSPHPRPVRFIKRIERGPADALVYSVTARALAAAARLGGVVLPEETWTDPGDALPVVRWAREKIDSTGTCLIYCTVSDGVRVANTAAEHGIDLRGAIIGGTGEPATPAKVNQIEQSGARWQSAYVLAETGVVGYGCANRVDGSDVHFCSDRFELIQVPRAVPGTGLTVDAFHLTTLSDLAPKVMLNTGLDDFGVVERRDCGCPLGEVGYDRHIREIFSFAKLTGEGVTLVGNDLVRILEEVLPARFGGTSLDYQLVEEEDENKLTRLSLIIDPRVRIDDESEVISTVVAELQATDAPSSMGGAIWAQSGTFRIKRMTPIITGVRGKLMPLHVSQRTQTTSRSP